MLLLRLSEVARKKGVSSKSAQVAMVNRKIFGAVGV